MDKYLFEDINSVWLKTIEKPHIIPEEEADINYISMILINEFSDIIHNITNKIIYNELSKRPNASLLQKILIKRQVINNVSENMLNITINMAKEKLDKIKNELKDEGLIPVTVSNNDNEDEDFQVDIIL